MFLAASIFGSLVYFSEKESDHKWLFSDSFWWVLSILSTTGVGDVQPSSILGKIIGMFCLMFGVVIVTLPLPIVWTAFAVKYRQHVMMNMMKMIKIQRKDALWKATVIENENILKEDIENTEKIDNEKRD